jgi:hypothetical protein
VERLEGSVTSSIVRFGCVALVAMMSFGCAASREGWGRGRFLVVHEAANLQVRRSTIRVDPPNGDLVMNWIGTRAPTGQSPVAEMNVIVFEDRNANLVAEPDEIRVSRHADGPAEKLLFSDVRVEHAVVPPLSSGTTGKAPLTMRVEARAVDGSVHESLHAFAPD